MRFLFQNKICPLFLSLLFCSQLVAQNNIRVRAVEYDDDKLNSVDSFRLLHIMIAGNVYQSEQQIKQAFLPGTKKYDFTSELRYINPVLNIGDVVIANLKTSFTGDLTSPFSSPDEFALAVKYSGINECVMANLNTAYIDKKGMLRTKKALEVFDVRTTGAFADNLTRMGNFPIIINKKGFKVALLDYANIQNRPSVSRDYLINQIDQTQIERDMKIARSQEPDFIIVYLDWGGNFQEYPAYSQENMARFILEQGADIVVGTFPNTVQRIDLMTYYYKQVEKQGLVCYSLGNLISSSDEDRTKAGIVMDIELKKNNFTGECHLGDYGFIPTWNYYDTVSSKKKLYVLPIAAVEQGEIFANIPAVEKKKMTTQVYDMRKMLGRASDEIQYNLSEMVVKNVEETVELTNSPLNNRFNPFDERNVKKSAAPTTKASVVVVHDTVYHIQFYELKKVIPIDTSYYDHLKGYEIVQEEGNYRYLIGASTDLEKVKELFSRVIKPRYKESFIVAYFEGRRVRKVSLK